MGSAEVRIMLLGSVWVLGFIVWAAIHAQSTSQSLAKRYQDSCLRR